MIADNGRKPLSGSTSVKLTFQKVEPVSKKDRVATLLKQAIISGAISSGEKIVEGTVAQQFGVGQGLIREALIELEYQGLVERTPFSNTRVSTLSDEDALQIFDIRIELEPLAFELAGRSLRPRDIDHLRELVAQTEENANSARLAHLFNSHFAFYRTVWELSGNKYLHQTLERLVGPLFILYLTRASFECEALMQNAFACSGRQAQILESIQAEDVCEVKRMVLDCLIEMKAIIVRKSGVSEKEANQSGGPSEEPFSRNL
jgi:DNA-binding GntR family transcriptional regulator